MGILDSLAKFVGGSLFSEVKSALMTYFPPELSEQEKMIFEIKVQELLHNREMEAQRMLNDAAAQLDKRIAEQEGTASDLKSIPILGTAIIFLRGMQRPVWGFLTMWMDMQWFFGTYTFTEQQQTAMIVINVLVLGFLFGERTIKNLEPLIIKVFAKSDKT